MTTTMMMMIIVMMTINSYLYWCKQY